MSSSSSKRNVFFATINNWKKNFPWLIIELENNLLSGLFCKVCLKCEGKWKFLGGYDGKFISQGKVISQHKKSLFIKISQNSQGNTCARDYFLKKFLAQVFPVNFAKFVRTTLLLNSSGRLLLTSFMTPKAKA